jgi:hypothetical protein
VTKALITLAALLPWAANAADVSIQYERGEFQVSNLSTEPMPKSGWEAVFAVYAGNGDVPPMAGTYHRVGQTLYFEPRYPLTPGVKYRAVYREVPPVEVVFDGPKAANGASARVDKVYPSTSLLPANQLRLYLEFSQPMSRGGIWKQIHLLRYDGKEIEHPFLDQELWDPTQRRLTLLFDPGLIKRGLASQEEILESGRTYTLVVDRTLRDARGRPLVASFRRQFHVDGPWRDAIYPRGWKLTATRKKLTVEFHRPLDWGLLQSSLRVNGVEGTVTIDNDERRWIFTPTQPWEAGHYELTIDTTLEDPAGNRIGRPFDAASGTARVTSDLITLGFDVR